ncbi:hypothetical protein [Calditerrivibrio nitroreducens]|uniref:Uncharacterized protein n=1 Tax=Calditerrivibrio nitroreducens (strain DSM 19672 / NBRC 101217 / Yu37-1) TaxID=768670 RepID=E4TEZ0_CALNY|nr:hypothetical protein [Calditerrivibrio nitroreducens]ADR18396.1 hypothetical protein Calni_0483 [Calditerrivibrio nitroreducens DSM 19672]
MNKVITNNIFLPKKIETLEKAHKYCIPGAIFTTLMGVLSFLHSIIYLPELLFLGFLDLVLWGVLGIGIYKNSRIAVINGFIMYILGGAYFRITPMWQSNLLATFYVITMLFAIRGAFAYQKILKEKNKGN